ncbi:hypothetical protein A0H76_844 [Hepatospora eriocheir]|uniref:Ricin B lectin domain-containing protein n=1 Tax=Hepatospora eriocheir TaxID=1081669 RepID=A0A1X0QIB6_9MICR|nr:hypothetical protein A0H76_844 [Hepatospora eriocheir]
MRLLIFKLISCVFFTTEKGFLIVNDRGILTVDTNEKNAGNFEFIHLNRDQSTSFKLKFGKNFIVNKKGKNNYFYLSSSSGKNDFFTMKLVPTNSDNKFHINHNVVCLSLSKNSYNQTVTRNDCGDDNILLFNYHKVIGHEPQIIS